MQSMQAQSGFSQDNHENLAELEFKPQEVKMTKDINIKFHAEYGLTS